MGWEKWVDLYCLIMFVMDDFVVDEKILELQEKLMLHPDFFEKLLEEDDWSFVIKLHALIEAAVGSLLLYHLEEPKLERIISRLELGNKTFGKLAFLKDLELLGDTYRRYIFSLSELRNEFVHNVHNCNTSLKGMVEVMDRKAIKTFALNFSPLELVFQDLSKINTYTLNDDLVKLLSVEELIDRAKQNPRVHIWIGAYNLLNHILDKYEFSNFLKNEKCK